MKNISIRKFRHEDKRALRQICVETSLFEQPGEFIDDKETVADVMTLYFTDYEPESCFVAVVDQRVVGYLTGTVNVIRMRQVFLKKILPELFKGCLKRGLFFKKKEQILAIKFLISFLKGEFLRPDTVQKYQALFHVNIDKSYRNQKIGRRLIDSFTVYLQELKVNSVRVDTMSEQAMRFFKQLGFKIIYETRRSCFKYILGRKVPVYIMGKSLKY